MRTHDDLVQSNRNVLYGDADGDVQAALGSGTSLAPQLHDGTGVSESSHFPGKRRRLDSIAEKPDACFADSAWESPQEQNSIWNE